MSYDGLRRACLEWHAIQQTRIKINNMVKAFERLERPYPPGIHDFIAELKKLERGLVKVIEIEAVTGEPWLQAVQAYVSAQRAIGPAILCVVGLVPPLPQFPNPAKLWAYLGLAVDGNGRAYKQPLPPPPNNPRGPKGSHFSRKVRAYATQAILDPIIRNKDNAYAALYHQRRAHTDATHPEWKLERNDKGDLTPAGHSHRDAIRYVAKRIWREVWRAAHGDQRLGDTQTKPVAAALPVEEE